MPFRLVAPFAPTGDQPAAIEALNGGLAAGIRFQTLLGVTGSGKTFTMANVIAQQDRPALILSHNKTLAAQLYEELRRFFPDNAVHYFVSYYDYYQPEAYIPQTDTYIAKDVKINAELDRLRHAATEAVLTRKDVIVVASVSAIYNIGSPDSYLSLALDLAEGQRLTLRAILKHLTELQYTRSDADVVPGTFRVRGGRITIASPTGEVLTGVTIEHGVITALTSKGSGLSDPERRTVRARIFPAKFWITPPETLPLALTNIEAELAERLRELRRTGKLLEAQRLEQRTREDLAMIRETGYCHGIENYSRQLEFREPGSPPFTLLDYFNRAFGRGAWLTFIDESHQTIPQLRGMVRGDRSRKDILIEYGFRLPSARDNRPLTFTEFLERAGQIIFASATPGPYEAKVSRRIAENRTPIMDRKQRRSGQRSFGRGRGTRIGKGFVEQLIRPTGILDPTIEIRSTEGQLGTLVRAIEERVERKQRVLVTTLTKRLAEELATWLSERSVRVEYLHADVETLDRPEILHRLRSGEVDVLVGINLLREGLDLPEVSLVAILDADEEGFLRNETTLLQTMGRAARHVDGHVILFADTMTQSMRAAIAETERRRRIQEAWNREHRITPRSIAKPVEPSTLIGQHRDETDATMEGAPNAELLRDLRRQLREAVEKLEFERAAKLRDLIARLNARR